MRSLFSWSSVPNTMIQYRNMNTGTPDFTIARRTDRDLNQDIFKPVAWRVYRSPMTPQCQRLFPDKAGFDERRLVQFLVFRIILRRLHKYLVWSGESLGPKPYWCHRFTSQHNLDQISLVTGLSGIQLEKRRTPTCLITQ